VLVFRMDGPRVCSRPAMEEAASRGRDALMKRAPLQIHRGMGWRLWVVHFVAPAETAPGFPTAGVRTPALFPFYRVVASANQPSHSNARACTTEFFFASGPLKTPKLQGFVRNRGWPRPAGVRMMAFRRAWDFFGVFPFHSWDSLRPSSQKSLQPNKEPLSPHPPLQKIKGGHPPPLRKLNFI